MKVDQSLAAGWTQAVLVEEQVSKAVVNEGTIEEFHALRLMRLTSADDDRSRLLPSGENPPVGQAARRTL